MILYANVLIIALMSGGQPQAEIGDDADLRLSISYLAVNQDFFQRIAIDLAGKTVISDIEAYFLLPSSKKEKRISRQRTLSLKEGQWLHVAFAKGSPPGTVRPGLFIALNRQPPESVRLTAIPSHSQPGTVVQARCTGLGSKDVLLCPLHYAQAKYRGVAILSAR